MIKMEAILYIIQINKPGCQNTKTFMLGGVGIQIQAVLSAMHAS